MARSSSAGAVVQSDAKIAVTPMQLARLLSSCISAREPVLIVGAPGLGKTQVAKQAAEAAKSDLIIAHPVVDSPIDYKGIPFVPKDGKAEFMPYGFLRAMMEAKQLMVVVLDDLGQAPPAVQAACMQLLLERSINGKKISDYVTFIACTNRKEDKAGVNGVLEPVKSRFITIVELVADLDSWVAWFLGTKLPTVVAAFIRTCPNYLHDFKPTSDMTNSPCPRTLENLAKLVAMKLPADIRFPAYAGAVGKACATEFIAFEAMADKMVDPSVIIMNPDTSPIPDTPDGVWATCMGLAHYAHEDNLDNIYAYGKRLPPDFLATMMEDILRHDSEAARKAGLASGHLQRHPAFLDFYSKSHQKHIA